MSEQEWVNLVSDEHSLCYSECKQTGMAKIDSDSIDDCETILKEAVDCSIPTNTMVKETSMDSKKRDKKGELTEL